MSLLRPWNFFNVMKVARSHASARSVEEIFIDPSVQRILGVISSNSLTRKPDVAFAPQQIPRKRSNIHMMTEEEYKNELENALNVAKSKMQPFPVKVPHIEHPPPGALLEKDLDLLGHSPHRYVFVDLTPDVPRRRNLVTVREPDGVLRNATTEESAKFRNMFFPQRQPGRLINTPTLFKNENLKVLLNDARYEYILKRACIQFDPDTEEFCRITQTVFEHLATNRQFECLDATPYFSNLIFFSVTSIAGLEEVVDPEAARKFSNLLFYFLSHGRFSDTLRVLQLCKIVHPKLFEKTVIPTEKVEYDDIYSHIQAALTSLDGILHEEERGELLLALQAVIDQNETQSAESTG